MYFEINGSVYRGVSDRDDSEDQFLMRLPSPCYDYRFSNDCLLVMELFDNAEGEERVSWVVYSLLEDVAIVSSIGDYAFCDTGVEGAWEDAEHEAQWLKHHSQEV